MCWINIKGRLLLAEKDIHVRKVVLEVNDDYCKSYYQQYLYKKGKIMDAIKIESQNFRIFKGYHSYSEDISIICNFPVIFFDLNVTCVEIKTKSGLTIDKIHVYSGPIRIANFIIPKGTKYIINDRGEIVSEQIIFDSYGNF